MNTNMAKTNSSVALDRVGGNPRIAFERAGSGETLLFLHGIGGNRSNWGEQLKVFSQHYQAVAWDMRGYGDSDDYEGYFQFDDALSDISRVLDYLGVKAAHLVGLSFGGRLGYQYAYKYPERTLSLTACSAV